MVAVDMVVSPVTLEAAQVRLEPLAKAHLEGLALVGLDEELWRWVPTPGGTRGEKAGYIETALSEQERSTSLPFSVVWRGPGGGVGGTPYGKILSPPHS